MSDRNLILKKSLDKIVSQSLERDKSLGGVETIEVTFLFRAPVRTAMCDWVYGLTIKTYNDDVNQPQIISQIKERIDSVTSQLTKDTFCLTDYYFE